MFEPDDLPLRGITRRSNAISEAELACNAPAEPVVSPIDPANLLARIEALEAMLAASNAKVSCLQIENQRLQNQLASSITIDGEEDSSENFTASRPPRKVAKKVAKGNGRSAAILSDMVTDEDFPSMPSVSRSMPASSNSSNRFAPLASSSASKSVSNTNNNNTAKAASGNTTNGNASSSNKTQQRKKVIQAIDTSLFAIRRQLTAAEISSFSVKQTRKSGPIKIVISDEAEVGPAKSALVKAKTSFHEFKWPNEKQKCFIIRGLVGATTEDLPEIKQELCEAGLPENIVVSLHQTGYMRANQSGSHDAPVKLLLPAGVDASILQGIRFLNHIAVRFDLFRSKSIVQCKNCQRFGHSAGGCQHPHRCVKCGENHLRDDCPRTHDSSVKLRCCNCGGEHTANNLNSCEFFKLHHAKANAAEAHAPTPTAARRTLPPAPRLPGVSFAQMVGTSSTRSMPASSHNRSTSHMPTSGSIINSAESATFDRRLSTLENNLSSIATAIKDISNKQDSSFQLFAKHDKMINLLIAHLNYE